MYHNLISIINIYLKKNLDKIHLHILYINIIFEQLLFSYYHFHHNIQSHQDYHKKNKKNNFLFNHYIFQNNFQLFNLKYMSIININIYTAPHKTHL